MNTEKQTVVDLLTTAFLESEDGLLAAKILESLVYAQKLEVEKDSLLLSPEAQKRAAEFDEIDAIYKEADYLCVMARAERTKAPAWAWAVMKGSIDTNPATLPRLLLWVKKTISNSDEVAKVNRYFNYRQTILNV